MGRQTTAEMLDEARLIYGIPEDDTKRDAATLMRWLNQSYIGDLCAAYAIPELEDYIAKNTAATNPTITFSGASETFLRVIDVVRASDSHKLTRSSWTDYAEAGGFLTTTTIGEPERWFVATDESNQILRIYPCPNAIYTLNIIVRIRPHELAIGEQTIIPEVWDEPIRAFFTCRVALSLRIFDEASAWRQYGTALANQALGLETYGTNVLKVPSGGRGMNRTGGE